MWWWHRSAAVPSQAASLDPSLWAWPDELPDDIVRQLAEVTLPLILEPERWIHRRVERIQFIDRQTVRRQVSADFTLPGQIAPIQLHDGQEVYAAPLFLLKRDHPRPFRVGRSKPWWSGDADQFRERMPMSLFSDLTLMDQAGVHQPLITRLESTRLASALLRHAAIRTSHGPLSADQLRDLAAVALARRKARKEALGRLLVQRPSNPRSLTPLGESDAAELICMMATCLPIVLLFKDRPPPRSIFKLSYVAPLDDDQAMLKWLIPRSMGWKSENLAVTINEIGAAASHHIEVEIPGDLQVNYVSLTGKRYTRANVPWQDLKSQDRDCAIRQVGTASSGNIYLSELPFARRLGRVSIKMRVRRTGFLMGALVTSIIITAVLLALTLLSNHLVNSGSPATPVAALLLFPSLVAAYIARPGEHIITARMLRWARFSLVGNAALPFLAVLIYLASVPKNESSSTLIRTIDDVLGIAPPKLHAGVLHTWLLGLTIASCTFSLLFIASNIWPHPHGESMHEFNATSP
jgi:hypothetical protein